MAKYAPVLAHKGHPKTIIPRNRTANAPGQHYGEVHCRLCRKFVRFATKQEVENFFATGVTDINNNNNTINYKNNVIISVGEADTSNEHVLQTSLGNTNAKGESPDSEGVRESQEAAQ